VTTIIGQRSFAILLDVSVVEPKDPPRKCPTCAGFGMTREQVPGVQPVACATCEGTGMVNRPKIATLQFHMSAPNAEEAAKRFGTMMTAALASGTARQVTRR